MKKTVVKPTLVYRLVPMEKAVVFQILEMDESQRISDTAFTASNGITVRSVGSPAINFTLTGTYVFLRGIYGDCDENVCTAEGFISNEARDEFIINAHQALREWHEVGGFEEARQYVNEPDRAVVTDGFTYRLEAGNCVRGAA